jgi:hypothetical protein
MTVKAKKTAPKKVAKTPAPKPHADVGKSAFTVEEFCYRNGNISEGTYRSLRVAGLGPEEMRPTGMSGGIVLISLAAEAAWQKQAADPNALIEEKAAYLASARAAKKKVA